MNRKINHKQSSSTGFLFSERLLDIARNLLKKHAQTGTTLTYREFAAALGITKSPIIRTGTALLEALILQDHLSKQPILASLVIQQSSNDIPRLGFYQILNDLSIYNGEAEGTAAIQWHQAEIKKLKKYYPSGNSNE